MQGLNKLLNDHSAEFPEFAYYRKLIGKSGNNVQTNPDISIEACNALLQGICKTTIMRLGEAVELADLNKKDTDWLFREAAKRIRDNDDVYEEDFVRRGVSLAYSIATLRNARGDISHGKAVPKTVSSNLELAKVVHEMTASLATYMLASLFAALAKAAQIKASPTPAPAPEFELDYADNSDFNDFLDMEHPPRGKVVHSQALFEMFREEYVIQLAAFRQDAEPEPKE